MRLSAPHFLGLAVLVLGGCQTLLPEEPVSLQLDDPAQLQNWEMTARMGYRSSRDSGSATLEWHQLDGSGRIRFSGPMGIGGAELDWDATRASLDTGRDQATAGSPAELAWQLTGLWLPVDALHFWVRGLAWPEAESHARRSRDGRLEQLQQLGWELEFDRYREVAGLKLPHRIRATHGDERFTFIVHDWQPLP